jgi:DnaJ like chaperone protein
MAWIGKVGGGILGFIAGGPVGALIGGALGHQFDRGSSFGGRTPHPGYESLESGAHTPAERQRLFFETTFFGLGALAKADGRVSESEIEAARGVMQDMGLGADAVRRAIHCFTAGKRPGFPIQGRVALLRQACGSEPELLRTFLEIQMEFLLGKESISARERGLLLGMAETLGVGRVDLAHLEAVLRARRGFRERRGPAASPRSPAGAYQALGLTPEATDAEVKTAYRRLMNQHHPDKQAARGMPESLLEAAKERTREIRAAYELIREQRGMK